MSDKTSQQPVIPTLRSPRKIAYQLVGLQGVLLLAVCLGYLIFSGTQPAYSALLGGIACILPSFLFANRLFSITKPQTAKKFVMTFYIGEFLKLVLSAVLVVLIVLLIKVNIIPLIIGFLGAQFGFWLAPALIKINQTKM